MFLLALFKGGLAGALILVAITIVLHTYLDMRADSERKRLRKLQKKFGRNGEWKRPR